MEATYRSSDFPVKHQRESFTSWRKRTVASGPMRGLHYGRILFDSILVFIFVLLVAIWFGTPYVLRAYINRNLAGLPDYTGRVEWVRVNPITATFNIYDFHIDKKSNAVPVPFFYSPRWKVSLQWSEILHGKQRASVTIYNPKINLVSGESSNDTQFSISKVWIDAIKQLIPWRVNQLVVRDGDVHFLDFHADPKVDLEINNLQFDAENMSNSKKLKVPLPATVKITGNPLRTGFFEMDMTVNLDERYATFSQKFQMVHVPAVGANSVLQKYLKVRVKSGDIGLYTELTGDKGVYHGYAKPFFHELVFEPKPSDKGTLGAVWAGVLNVVKDVFENDHKDVATDVQISGRVDQPEVDTLQAIGGALWNAWIQALRPGFEPEKTPPQPTDTVTTPKSAETAKEATQPSPAEKKK
jgi:hypothetical protein